MPNWSTLVISGVPNATSKFASCTRIHGHDGETCEEYDYRKSHKKDLDQQMQASVKAISQLTKKCPRNNGKCGWNIENGGCDHMTCMIPFLIAVPMN